MTFRQRLNQLGNWLRGTPKTDERHQLLAFLSKAYVDESKDILNFTHHAGQMYYPHLQQRFLQIVKEEQSHVEWLKEKILFLGGDVPVVSFSPTHGANTWENLRRDLEEERTDDAAFLEALRLAEHVDRGIAEGLSRLRLEERRHREQLLDLLHKSEPDTVPAPRSQLESLEQQKRTWLAQEKMAWLEQRRAQWQSQGKLLSWAEWLARREYEWTANELPNRELHWARQLTQPTATDNVVPRVSGKL